MDAFVEAARRAGAGAASLPSAAPAPHGGELALRPDPNPARDAVVVNPETGQVFDDPAEIPSDALAQIAYMLRQRENDYRQWKTAVDRELRARLSTAGRKQARVGAYDIALKPNNRREWDSKELAGVLAELIEQHVVQASEVAELFHTQVDGTLARQVLNRLSGQAHAAVKACYVLREGTPRLDITPAALEPGESGQG